MQSTPITLFVYARLHHTQRTVEALLKNPLCATHDLIIFSDGARTPEYQTAVNEVRAYLTTIIGFRSVKIYQRPHNFGLAKSIIAGVTQVLSEHERIIVLEDDMVTSHHFLAYMVDALERFAEDERVISVHGYVYPLEQKLPEAFFLRGADCWGWGTWRRGWRLFNPDGQSLFKELQQNGLIKDFDFNGTYAYSTMLKNQTRGLNDSWAVRWYASAYLANKLTLYPGRSLVHNIGNDSTGEHCGDESVFDTELSRTAIDLSAVVATPSEVGRAAFESFFRNKQISLFGRLRNRIKKLIFKTAR